MSSLCLMLGWVTANCSVEVELEAAVLAVMLDVVVRLLTFA